MISLLQPGTRALDPFTQKRLVRLTALAMFLALLAFGLTIAWFFSSNAPRWVHIGAAVVDAFALEASGRAYRLTHAEKRGEL